MDGSNRRNVQIHVAFSTLSVVSTTVQVEGQPPAHAVFSKDEFTQPWLKSLMEIARATLSQNITANNAAATPLAAAAPQKRRFASISQDGIDTSEWPQREAPSDENEERVLTPPKLNRAAKRMAKLESQLADFENYKTGDLLEHGQLITQLICPEGEPSNAGSMRQVARLLISMAPSSAVSTVIYTLLSWNIFSEEEQDLVRRKHVSPPVAAKEINALMAKLYDKDTASLDWASDGRRTAGVVFGAFNECQCSMTVRSFALVALAQTSTVDWLLKMAHFPSLRDRFYDAFVKLLRNRTSEWETLASFGYAVFDYESFLAKLQGQPDPEGKSRACEPQPSTSQAISDLSDGASFDAIAPLQDSQNVAIGSVGHGELLPTGFPVAVQPEQPQALAPTDIDWTGECMTVF